MKHSERTLVYTFNKKIDDDNSFYFSEESFLRPPVNYYDISIPLLEKKKIESSYLNEKPFLELFSYKNNSLWWMFDHFYFWNSFTEIIYFIDNFSKTLDEINPQYVVVEDFKMFDIIKQICIQNNIKLSYSKFYYLRFLIKSKIISFFRNKIRGFRLKKRLKNIIQTNRQMFSKSKLVININKKILFAIPTTYRRLIYNFESETFEKGEHLVEPIMQITKQKYDVTGMSLTHFSNYSQNILNERLDSKITWFPEESILLPKSKDHLNFLKKYVDLISDPHFQNLFEYKNINIWNSLKHIFIQLQFEPYFPYWMRLIDSFSKLFESQKPKVILFPSETDAIQRCIISVAYDYKIKTVGIQHGEGTKDAEHSESNLRSESNLLGCPYPDKMLLFGNFTKREYQKQGYPESKFVEFCNPNYIDLDKIIKISKTKLKEKYLLDTNKKILLFTTSRYTSKKYNFDILILEKLISEFKNNDKFIFLIKPHPSEELETYQTLLSKNLSNFQLIQGNILELILISDAVISNTSTAIVDAISLKTPVLEPKWKFWIDLFGESDVVLFSEIDDMKNNIFKILDESYLNDALLSKYENFMKDHYNLPTTLKQLENILDKVINE